MILPSAPTMHRPYGMLANAVSSHMLVRDSLDAVDASLRSRAAPKPMPTAMATHNVTAMPM